MYLRFLTTFILAIVTILGQDVAKPKTMIVQVIPADAVEVRSDIYRKIEQGKPIIYIRTPMGITRAEQTEVMRGVIEDGPPMGVRFHETTTEYFFERDTPFGTPKWSKKKNSSEKLDILGADELETINYYRKLKQKLTESSNKTSTTKATK